MVAATPHQSRSVTGGVLVAVNRLAMLPTLEPQDRQLIDSIKAEIIPAYCNVRYGRQHAITEWLDGWRYRTLHEVATADGVTERTILQWIADFARWADDYLEHNRERSSAAAILRSICAMTHGRSKSPNSGDRPRVGATMCYGCTASAA